MFGLAIMMHFQGAAVGHKNWTTICTTHTQPLNLAKLIMYHTNCKTSGNNIEPWLVYILNICSRGFRKPVNLQRCILELVNQFIFEKINVL